MFKQFTMNQKELPRLWLSIGLIMLLLLALNLVGASAQENISRDLGGAVRIYASANSAYEQSRYNQALEGYNQLLKAGFNGGGLYYNLGNSYFKLYDKGHAVLYYEKAMRLIPRDTALQANLTLALNGVEEGRPGWVRESYRALVTLAPLNQLALAGSVCFFVLMIGLCFRSLFQANHTLGSPGKFRKLWQGIVVLMGMVTVLCWAMTFLTYIDQHQDQGVIVKPAVAYYETLPDAATAFQLAPGSRLRILKQTGEWSYIERRDGKRGWVRMSCYEEI